MKFEGVLAACALAAVAVACQQNGASEAQASTESALTASQQCLRQASNEDLLAEVAARMQSGGTSSGGTTGSGAIGTYTCDSSTYLHLSVVGPDGTEKTAEVYLGSNDRCQQTASSLGRTRRDITRTMLIGVCDSSTYLNRFSVTAAGGLQQLPQVYVGSADGCTSQQNDMNR